MTRDELKGLTGRKWLLEVDRDDLEAIEAYRMAGMLIAKPPNASLDVKRRKDDDGEWVRR